MISMWSISQPVNVESPIPVHRAGPRRLKSEGVPPGGILPMIVVLSELILHVSNYFLAQLIGLLEIMKYCKK